MCWNEREQNEKREPKKCIRGMSRNNNNGDTIRIFVDVSVDTLSKWCSIVHFFSLRGGTWKKIPYCLEQCYKYSPIIFVWTCAIRYCFSTRIQYTLLLCVQIPVRFNEFLIFKFHMKSCCFLLFKFQHKNYILLNNKFLNTVNEPSNWSIHDGYLEIITQKKSTPNDRDAIFSSLFLLSFF